MSVTPDQMSAQHCAQSEAATSQALDQIVASGPEAGGEKHCDGCLIQACTSMSCASVPMGVTSTALLTLEDVSQNIWMVANSANPCTRHIPLFKPPRV